MPRQRLTLIILAIVALCLAGLGAAIVWQTRSNPLVRTSGEALVGGPFEMVDHNGRTVTDQDFRGRYMLIFFGFTYCPDVCPLTLDIVSAALDELGPAADEIAPIFVTVDPERDTPDIVRAYLAHFDERFIGLTGSRAQVDTMLQNYRVYAARTGEADSPDYLMNHSSIVYLMGPDGAFVGHFSQLPTPDALADEIRRKL